MATPEIRVSTGEEIAIAHAFRQALETDTGLGNGGNVVMGTHNLTQAYLHGHFNLLDAAKLVVARLEAHRAAIAEQLHKELQAAMEKAEKSSPAGNVP